MYLLSARFQPAPPLQHDEFFYILELSEHIMRTNLITYAFDLNLPLSPYLVSLPLFLVASAADSNCQ